MAVDRANVNVEEAAASSAEIVEAVGRLVGQLSSSAVAPSFEQVQELINSPATRLLLAREGDGRIVGMLTLVVFAIPTGVRAWIEDVVVDSDLRGQGVGALLTREALRLAQLSGARTVELTSRPTREAANRLYAKLGFRVRQTNVYRYERPPGH